MTPAATLYDLAGSPAIDGAEAVSTRCAVCGGETISAHRYDRWQGANFTDQNKLRHPASPWVCTPCVWVHSWVPPPGMAPDPDAKKGKNLRLYSHFWSEPGGYWYGNKADKARILAWLRDPPAGPWFAAITDTGQKHVIPWTPINRGGWGFARFEERDVAVTPTLLSLIDEMVHLLALGCRKGEIEVGEYWHTRILLEDVRGFENRRSRLRGGETFDLALWLAQAPEETYARDIRPTGADSRGSRQPPPRAAVRVPGCGGESPETLGPAPRAAARRGRGRGFDPGAGDGAGVEPQAPGAWQLALFGDGGAR